MGCEEYRENLELVTSLESQEPGLQATISHIKECPQCTEAFASIHKLDGVIQEKMEAIDVPPFLASRLRARLRQTESSAHPARWQWAYVVGVFLFAGSLIFYNQIQIISRLEHLAGTVSQQTGLSGVTPANTQMDLLPSHNAILQRVADQALNRHRKILASKFVVFENIKVDTGFQDKFNFPLVLPNFSKELNLVGGSKCHSCVYEMAYLLYRHGRDSVSLCIFPDSDFGLSQWRGKPRTFRKSGHNVAIWKEQHSVYALVFKLPVSEVRSLVWDIQQKVTPAGKN